MVSIAHIHAREILDSRGNPTVEVDVALDLGNKRLSLGRASVPSGASTGAHEALELRDGDKKRYLGKGVKKAVANVQKLGEKLKGMPIPSLQFLDEKLIELDGTENKSKYGANATLGISLAVAKAAAGANKRPLYAFVGGAGAHVLPVPMMNIINGGAHADNPIDIQEFMIMPVGVKSMAEAIRVGAEIFHALKKQLQTAGHNTGIGDEGGFAPNLKSAEEACNFICKAIKKAGYTPGDDVVLALDAAASEFHKKGKYVLEGEGKTLNVDGMIKYYEKLIKKFPIVSIEDAMGEHDKEGWAAITAALGKKIQLVGDDLFVTNPKILEAGIKDKLANALLVKVNQIGTLTETLRAVKMAHDAGYKAVMSHRSGETEDSTIAHLAVATNCGQIKTGAPCRGERTAKYNELIRIEEQLGSKAKYAGKTVLKK